MQIRNSNRAVWIASLILTSLPAAAQTGEPGASRPAEVPPPAPAESDKPVQTETSPKTPTDGAPGESAPAAVAPAPAEPTTPPTEPTPPAEEPTPPTAPSARTPPPTPASAASEEPVEGPPPGPRDTLSGHFQGGLTGAFALPFGTVSDGVSERDRVGDGIGFNLDLGYGVHRNVVLGVYGQLLSLGDGNDCSDCPANAYAGGAFVRYHLVQGLRFDPWLSYGIGYRFQSTDPSEGDSLDYSGLDWMRLQFGGEWYAWSQLGFGPLLELSAGTFFSRPDGEDGGGVYWNFLAGLRVVVDLPGK